MKKYFKEFIGTLVLIICFIILTITFIAIGKYYNDTILIVIGITINVLTIIMLIVINIQEINERDKIIHNLNEKITEEHTSVIMTRMMCNQALSDALILRKIIDQKNKKIEKYEKHINELIHKINCINNEAKELQDLCNRYETQYGKLTDQE